ncbi:MAG: acyltransferase [Ignavibacteria bacterium]|jgi:peptidoglycan/LPS O-acetylase OafA/YrhL|nr:acyltransferase [Ignavibacteria bacterium]MCU7502732.1 acyltransferase [Ignavibacteria bacterium]MCU7517339.1 acyltransferase [Ignavibacteria bacterium]
METDAGLQISKSRDNNIELLRIIAMLMIVAHHYMWHGGALKQCATYSIDWFFAWTVEALSVVAVNCYVLISSYFLVNSGFKLKKLLRLWIQVLFYSLGAYFFLIAIGLEQLGAKKIITSSFPLLTNRYWFITVYVALYIFSPFLNILIHALSKKQMQNLVMILFALFCVWPTILPVQVSLDYTNGYSIIQFVFLYFIGAYLRLHWNHEIKKIYYIGTHVFIIVIMVASKTVLSSLGFDNISFGSKSVSYCFFEYNSLTVVLSSVLLFLFFRGMTLKSTLLNKMTRSIPALTLGVYLIHDHPYVRPVLYSKFLQTYLFWNSPVFIPVAIGSILGVFIVCLCIDAVRKKIFTVLENTKLLCLINKSISLSAAKISNFIYRKIAVSLNSIEK